MPHMVPCYSNETFAEIENEHGESYLIPAEYAMPEADEDVTATYSGKWFCRLSAPGYMDATEWSGPFDTLEAAKESIESTYDVDPETGEELDG